MHFYLRCKSSNIAIIILSPLENLTSSILLALISRVRCDFSSAGSKKSSGRPLSCISEDRLKGQCPAVSDEVAGHLHVVLCALEGMIAKAVMGGATPTSWEVGRIPDGEAEFS